MSRCKFNKKKGVILSKKTRDLPMGMDAETMLNFVEDAAPYILEKNQSLDTAYPALKHALINKLKELDSSS